MGHTQRYFNPKFQISLSLVQKWPSTTTSKFWPKLAFFIDFLNFKADKWVNPKNKATFITEPQKVFIVKVVLFLPIDYILG